MKASVFLSILQIVVATNLTLMAQGDMRPFHDSLDLSKEKFLDFVAAAGRGETEAAEALSTYFSVVMADEPSSIYYSELAAKNGGDRERENLATQRDSIVLKNSELSELKKKAKAGNARAAESLGSHYWVIRKSKLEAIKWFKVASQNGDFLDQYRYLRAVAMSRGLQPMQCPGKREPAGTGF